MRAEEKIIKAFYDQNENKLYFNQLKELTQLSNSSLQNALNKLLENKTLKSRKTKSNIFYEIKDLKLIALKFAEISINKSRELSRGIRIPLIEFLSQLSNTIFTVVLFGSASRNKEQEGSDIDLLIVSEKKLNLEKNKKQAEIISNYPLNLFYCNINQFKEAKDHIIIQARKTGFPIRGEQNFHEVVIHEN